MSRYIRIGLVGLTLLSAADRTAGSQVAPLVERGSKVRITPPGAHAQVGVVLALRADSIVVQPDDSAASPVGFARAAGTQIEVTNGKKRHPILGLLIGAGVGAVAGQIEARGSNDSCESSQPLCNLGKSLANDFAPMAGALVGAVAGLFIGTMVRTPRWVSVPLEQVRIGASPAIGARGPGVSLSFSHSWQF